MDGNLLRLSLLAMTSNIVGGMPSCINGGTKKNRRLIWIICNVMETWLSMAKGLPSMRKISRHPRKKEIGCKRTNSCFTYR